MILWSLLALYLLGFIGALAFNLAIGPVTLGLALLRAAVWPIWVATGWPAGAPMPMD